jgi:hypothetical protein
MTSELKFKAFWPLAVLTPDFVELATASCVDEKDLPAGKPTWTFRAS